MSNVGVQPPPVALPGGNLKQVAVMNQRYQAHPLNPLQKRDSKFSKEPTCFEAQLSILDPDNTDQRDYTLMVQNERGHQAAVVRLKVSSPLSPVLMITSAFVTICGLFLCSLVVIFLIKRRPGSGNGTSRRPPGSGAANGNLNGGAHDILASEKNGLKTGPVEYLVDGGPMANGNQQQNQQLMQQQTRNGIVNGTGNGVLNNASNPQAEFHKNEAMKHHALLASMGGSSDTSNDQKQLLLSASSAGSSSNQSNSNNSDRHSQGSGQLSSANTATTNPIVSHRHGHHSDSPSAHILNSPSSCQLNSNGELLTSSNSCSLENSPIPTSMNHISVDDDDVSLNGLRQPQGSSSSTYQAGESVMPHRDQLGQPQFHPQRHPANDSGALIYANLDYANNEASRHSSIEQQQDLQANYNSSKPTFRSNVGATIAMMNSLAKGQSNLSSPSSNVGAINQQLANSRQIRKPGPPKPPKPSIQQRSRFYQQQQQQANNNGLVMIGSLNQPHDELGPTANELAVEYSRIAFPARAEL